ncbi:MAG: rod shape-determining protein MreC [Tepidisphaeraceae bacterium]|jgi:cell shape-determining protein MreC
MARIRFNHVFIPLMLAAGVASFVLPPGAGQGVRGRIDGVFTPVAYPVRRVAHAFSARWNKPEVIGLDVSHMPQDAITEIQLLKNQVASLTTQLDVLRELSAGRELMGDAQKYAVPLRVVGGDAAGREWLTLRTGGSDGLLPGQAVVRRDSLVGKVASVGSSGTSVRLITDRGFRISAQFGRFRQSADGRGIEFAALKSPPPLVEGRGSGRLTVSNLTLAAVYDAGLTAGDYVVLKDPDDWPVVVNGFIIGQVESIEKQPKATLFAEIQVKPRLNLMQLNEVMVVTEAGSAPARPAVRVATPAQQPPIRGAAAKTAAPVKKGGR